MSDPIDFRAALAVRDHKRIDELRWDLDRHERAIERLVNDRDAIRTRIEHASNTPMLCDRSDRVSHPGLS